MKIIEIDVSKTIEVITDLGMKACRELNRDDDDIPTYKKEVATIHEEDHRRHWMEIVRLKKEVLPRLRSSAPDALCPYLDRECVRRCVAFLPEAVICKDNRNKGYLLSFPKLRVPTCKRMEAPINMEASR